MSIEDVLAQQTQMMKMLKGVANAVAQLQTQVPATQVPATQVPATQVPVFGVKSAKKAPPTSFFGEKGVAEALPKPPQVAEVTDYGVDTGALAVATPVPAGMSQEEAALPAAKQDPLYMAAVSKLGNNEPLTPEEQQAYDKVKGIEASLQAAQQKGGRRKQTKRARKMKPRKTYRKTNR